MGLSKKPVLLQYGDTCDEKSSDILGENRYLISANFVKIDILEVRIL